jgi:hypothetical protein
MIQILLGLAVLVVLAIGMYFIPPIHVKLAWRINDLRTNIIYFFHPPQDVTFQPSGQSQSAPTDSASLAPSPTSTPAVTATPLPTELATDTPTVTSTPVPDSVILANIPFVNQTGRHNYCGPANLTMALEYWGWKGDPKSPFPDLRDQVGSVIMPGVDDPTLTFVQRINSDVNVMPYELVDFVNQHTTYKALFRYGGDADLLKRLIAAGFPVITEKGIYEPLSPENTVQWGGHYAFTTGYDDVKKEFTWQDSYEPPTKPVGNNTKTSYAEFLDGWRAFNYVFVVVYPADQETQLDQILGPWADQYWAAQHALDIANQEIQSNTLTGNDLFFAMFNQVTSYVYLKNPDYGKAGAAYDQANAYYNNQLIQIDKAANQPLPYRIMWYETAPYYAYYYTGRYQDVINLAEVNLNKIMATRSLEESWYWMARAEYALGNYDTAYANMRKALYYHPNFQPALDMFALWGVSP